MGRKRVAVVEAVNRFEIWLVTLNPTQGSEIQKTRPCLVISPNEINTWLRTIIIAPMTTGGRSYPSRVNIRFQGKNGQVALDQLRTVDKSRLVKRLGNAPEKTTLAVSQTLIEMFSI